MKATLIILTTIILATCGILAISNVKSDKEMTKLDFAYLSTMNEVSDIDAAASKARVDSLFEKTDIYIDNQINYGLLLTDKVFDYKEVEYSTNDLLYILQQSFFTENEEQKAGRLEITSLNKIGDKYYANAFADISKVSKKLGIFAPKNTSFNATVCFSIIEKSGNTKVVCEKVSHPIGKIIAKTILSLSKKESFEELVNERLSLIMYNIGVTNEV